MNRLFRRTVVETSGVRTISGGGTNASNAGQALSNLLGVSITGDQTISGIKTFINTARVDSVNFTKNFFSTGGIYNHTSSGIVNLFATGVVFTGWNIASINPSDDSRSIKLSSGSYIRINSTDRGGSYVFTWEVIKNTGNLLDRVPFNLFSGNTPLNSIAINPSSPFVSVSGFLPLEYDRFILRIVGGGGNIPFVNVSGDLGINSEIRLESRGNRLFLGNSRVLFDGEAVAPLVDINNITGNFNFNDSYNSKFLTINTSQNITGTVPTGLGIGYNISFAQIGTGRLFITGANGVNIRQRLNLYNTAGQYAVASLIHYSGNQYLLYGDLN
jgi:hypothetical protein